MSSNPLSSAQLRRSSAAIVWGMIVLSLCLICFVVPAEKARCYGGFFISSTGFWIGMAGVALCVGTFLSCRRAFVTAKIISFLLLWPAVYLGLEVACRRLLTPEILHYFHTHWNI